MYVPRIMRMFLNAQNVSTFWLCAHSCCHFVLAPSENRNIITSFACKKKAKNKGSINIKEKNKRQYSKYGRMVDL